MRWWLVRDAVHRQLYAVLTAVLVLTIFWTQVPKERWTTVAVIGSMIFTFSLGPFIALTTIALREIRLRPVSRRTVWQATWILSVVVAPLIAALGKVAGGFAVWMADGNVAAFASIASLSWLYDAVFAGLMLGVLMLVRWVPTPRSRGLRRIAIELWPFACFLVFFPGGWLLPVLAYQYLPHSWTAITWNTAGFLIAAAGVGVSSWFSTAPAAQPGFARLQQVHATRVSAPARPGTASGWRVVAWLELRFLLMVLGLAVLTAIVAGPMLRMFGPTASIPEMAAAIVRYFFSPAPSRGFSLSVFAAAITGAMATSHLLQPMLRQLRTLPVSRVHLTATMLLLPLAHVVLIWIILALLYVLREHAWPPALRLDILALAAGFAMFSQSFQMRFPLRGFQFPTVLIAPAMMIGWSAIGGGETNEQLALFAAGATTLCVALGATMTLAALSRAATYRPGAALGPWGAPAPTQR